MASWAAPLRPCLRLAWSSESTASPNNILSPFGVEARTTPLSSTQPVTVRSSVRLASTCDPFAAGFKNDDFPSPIHFRQFRRTGIGREVDLGHAHHRAALEVGGSGGKAGGKQTADN